MSTPAVNKDVWSSVESMQTYDITLDGVSQYAFTFPATFFDGRVIDIRPESLLNPLRPNGTRARSAWSHRKLNFHTQPKKRVWTFPDGPYVIVYTGSQMPAIDSSVFTQSCEAVAWISDISGSTFPYGVEARAITQAINKLRNQKYEFGAALAELGETAGFISDVVEKGITPGLEQLLSEFPGDRESGADWFLRLTGGELKSHQKGKYGPRVRNHANRLWGNKAEKLMRATISAWMAYQFAVKPLLFDIEDAKMALGEVLFGEDARPLRVIVQTGCQENERVWFTHHSGQVSPGWDVGMHVILTTRCRISAEYDVHKTSDSRAESWGLTNSYSILYEATPLSWMFDYLTNTGDWLQTLTPVEGADFVEGTITRYQEVSPGSNIQFSPNQTTLDLRDGFTPEKWTLDGMRIERSHIPPYGLLPAIRPAFMNKLNLTRVANVMGAFSLLLGR